MKNVEVRLDFPLERIQEPVVTFLVKNFDVAPNVLAANIDAVKGGWMLLGLQGDDSRVDQALIWVEETGIKVTLQ